MNGCVWGGWWWWYVLPCAERHHQPWHSQLAVRACTLQSAEQPAGGRRFLSTGYSTLAPETPEPPTNQLTCPTCLSIAIHLYCSSLQAAASRLRVRSAVARSLNCFHLWSTPPLPPPPPPTAPFQSFLLLCVNLIQPAVCSVQCEETPVKLRNPVSARFSSSSSHRASHLFSGERVPMLWQPTNHPSPPRAFHPASFDFVQTLTHCERLSAERLMPCHTPHWNLKTLRRKIALKSVDDSVILTELLFQSGTDWTQKFWRATGLNHLGYLSPYLLLRSFPITQLSRPPPTCPSQ